MVTRMGISQLWLCPSSGTVHTRVVVLEEQGGAWRAADVHAWDPHLPDPHVMSDKDLESMGRLETPWQLAKAAGNNDHEKCLTTV